MRPNARAIAFYLPQFHPTAENDQWWGKGFTEWTNVAKAKPLFGGHYQPRLPADLGFYDLRLPEAREAQAKLAQHYGIHGFCYYHYWFGGRQILEKPVREIVESGEPNYPFCLCWANENWTKTWNGDEKQVLLRQSYSAKDDVHHIRAILPTLKDARYITVQGKPLLLIYRVNSLPEPAATAERWRREASAAGLNGLYLCNVMSHPDARVDPTSIGFDAAVDFQPDWSDLPPFIRPTVFRRLLRKTRLGKTTAFETNMVMEYADLVRRMTSRLEPQFKYLPGVALGWDNSPRRASNAMIYVNSTPSLYAQWLIHAGRVAARHRSTGEDVVFINAWNEWAEGTYLEPDQRWGLAYLEATQAALRQI